METIINITSVRYTKDIISDEVCGIIAVINGETSTVPLDEGNVHYNEIMRRVEAGELMIEEAE